MGLPILNYLGSRRRRVIPAGRLPALAFLGRRRPRPVASGAWPLLFFLGRLARLPATLADAIAARFADRPGLAAAGFTAIFQTQAGQKVQLPYLVFMIPSGTTLLTTDTDYWTTRRVSFASYAATQEQANALREAVVRGFGSGAYEYVAGFSIPFFESGRSEAKEPSRTISGAFVFRASIDYDARCRRA